MRFILALVLTISAALAQTGVTLSPATVTGNFDKAIHTEITLPEVTLTAPSTAYHAFTVWVPAEFENVVSVTPPAGFLFPSQSVTITIKAKALSLNTGSYQFPVSFTGIGTPTVSLGVVLNVTDSTEWVLPSANSRLVPHIAAGGGWTTRIRLVNTGSENSFATVAFKSGAGRPQAFNVNGFTTELIPAITVPAGGLVEFEITAGELTTGTALIRILEGPALGVNATYHNSKPAFESAVEIKPPTAQRLSLVFDNRQRNSTGVAIANGANLSQTVALTFRDVQGQVLGSETLQVPSLGHVIFTLDQMFPVTKNQRGVLTIQGTQEALAAFGLKFDLNTGVFYTEPAVQ